MRKHLVRVVPDEKIIKYLDEINHEISTILEISGENWRTKFLSKKVINEKTDKRKHYVMLIGEF